MYFTGSLKHFIDDLASEKSSPGGGSVAALTGLQAVSLVLMVANLTLGKKKYEDVQDQIQAVIADAEKIKRSIETKIDQDVEIFSEIMNCYSIPKESREAPLQKALEKSSRFSFTMMEEGLEIMKYAKIIGEIGNKNLISDAAIAVLLGYNTIELAAINVRINLGPLKNPGLVEILEKEMSDIFTQGKKLKEEALQIIGKSLKVGA